MLKISLAPVWIAFTACAVKSAGVDAPAAPATVAPAAVVVSSDGGRRPIFPRCVLHTGGAETRKRTRVRYPDGGAEELPPSGPSSCRFDAECVRRQSEPGDGGDDGFVNVACRGTTCECVLETVGDRARHRDTFELPEPCETIQEAQRLLIDVCMRGMPAPLR